MNKILFLDIDGVLNYESFYDEMPDFDVHPMSNISKKAINNLNNLL